MDRKLLFVLEDDSNTENFGKISVVWININREEIHDEVFYTSNNERVSLYSMYANIIKHQGKIHVSTLSDECH